VSSLVVRACAGGADKLAINSGYFYIETILKRQNENILLYQCPTYSEDIKTWMDFDGYNEQYATLT